jgi:hypothetical protein
MKKILIAAALLPLVALGGCAGLIQGNVTSAIASLEAAVQNDANLVCGFIPGIATIAGFVPGAGAIGADAASIAESICAAVGAAPATPAAAVKSLRHGTAVNVATVYVPGHGNVSISGKFTR